jgi:hypothetical protein
MLRQLALVFFCSSPCVGWLLAGNSTCTALIDWRPYFGYVVQCEDNGCGKGCKYINSSTAGEFFGACTCLTFENPENEWGDLKCLAKLILPNYPSGQGAYPVCEDLCDDGCELIDTIPTWPLEAPQPICSKCTDTQ